MFATVKEKVPTISFGTVYRTLALFEHYGVISRVEYLDDKTRYDSEMTHHHHPVCKRCRKIKDLSWPDVDALQTPPEAADWGKIENRHMELRGICRDCLAKDSRA